VAPGYIESPVRLVLELLRYAKPGASVPFESIWVIAPWLRSPQARRDRRRRTDLNATTSPGGKVPPPPASAFISTGVKACNPIGLDNAYP
jgi:hypothetical protein